VQAVALATRLGVLHGDGASIHLGDDAVFLGDHHVGGVACGPGLDSGADERGLGTHQRHGLLLHVGAHERTVGVIVLEERNEGGADRHDLLRRHVHQLNLGGLHQLDGGGGTEEHVALQLQPEVLQRRGLRRAAHQHTLVEEGAVFVEPGVGLGDGVELFLISGEPHDLAGGHAVGDLAVRGLDEAELVDPGVGGQGSDQADVWAFRGFDGAHAAVVAEVHVPHLEARTLTGQTAGAERRETATVGEARQRVHLVHELAQLGRSEELLDGGHHRADVDQRLWRDRLDVLGGHAFAHHPLHAAQADAHLVLDQLTHRANATVGEVVLVVQAVAGGARSQVEQVGGGGQQLHAGQHRQILVGQVDVIGQHGEHVEEVLHLGAQLAVELVTAHAAEVVAAALEECVLEVVA